MSVADKLSALATAAAEAAAAMRGVPADAVPPPAAAVVPPAAAPFSPPGWLAAPQMSARNAARAREVEQRRAVLAGREQERRLRAAEDAPEMARRAEVIAQRKDRFMTMPIQELMALRWAQPPANYASVTPDIRTKWHRMRHEVDAAYEMRSPEVDEFERAGIEAMKAAGVPPEEAQWIYMGKEGSEYRLPQGTSVRFGKDDKWIEKRVGPINPYAHLREDWADFYINPKNGVITASTDVFGDIAPGVEKEIWRRSRAADAEINAEADEEARSAAAAGNEEVLAFHERGRAALAESAKWTLIGREGETVEVAPGTTVRYGDIEKVVGPEGRITADNNTFGRDPQPGVVKQLYKRIGGRRRKTRRRKTRHHRRSKTSKRA